jgi:hypothetical protein
LEEAAVAEQKYYLDIYLDTEENNGKYQSVELKRENKNVAYQKC